MVLLGWALLAALTVACGKATPPPLTPDGPDMDLDAALYQDDSSDQVVVPAL